MSDSRIEEQRVAEQERSSENVAKAYRILFWGLVFELIVVIIAFFIILPIYIGGLSIYALLIFIAIWVKKTIVIVDGNEMGVLIIVGTPVSFVDSGLHVVPWFWGNKIEKYPKKKYNLDYPKRAIITKKGTWPTRGKDKTEYGKQVIKLDSTAYINFPRNERLIDIYKNHIPADEESLKNWTEETVVSSLRVAFGSRTWGEATEKFETAKDQADENFRKPNGTMIQAGFEESGIELAVEEIFLPPSIERKLTILDESRLEKEASVYYADEEAEKTVGSVMEMMKKETGMTRKQIEKELKENPEQFIKDHKKLWEKSWDLLHRNMAIKGGSFVDVRVDGANMGSLEKLLLEVFSVWQRMPRGGNSSSKKESSKDEGSFTKEEIRQEIGSHIN